MSSEAISRPVSRQDTRRSIADEPRLLGGHAGPYAGTRDLLGKVRMEDYWEDYAEQSISGLPDVLTMLANDIAAVKSKCVELGGRSFVVRGGQAHIKGPLSARKCRQKLVPDSAAKTYIRGLKDVPSSNMAVLMLMNQVTHVANHLDEGCYESAGDRLYRVITTIMTERKTEAVQKRLQELVFLCRRPKTRAFKLPEAIESPRAVHDVEARLAWWWNARSHQSRKKVAAPPLGQPQPDAPPAPSWSRALSDQPTRILSNLSFAERGGILRSIEDRDPEYLAQRTQLMMTAQLRGTRGTSLQSKLSDPRKMLVERKKACLGPIVTKRQRQASILTNIEYLTEEDVIRQEVIEGDPLDDLLARPLEPQLDFEASSMHWEKESDSESDGWMSQGGMTPTLGVAENTAVHRRSSRAELINAIDDAFGGTLSSGFVTNQSRPSTAMEEGSPRGRRMARSTTIGHDLPFKGDLTLKMPSAPGRSTTIGHDLPFKGDLALKMPSAQRGRPSNIAPSSSAPDLARSPSCQAVETPPGLLPIARRLPEYFSDASPERPVPLSLDTTTMTSKSRNPRRPGRSRASTESAPLRRPITTSSMPVKPWGAHFEADSLRIPGYKKPPASKQVVSFAHQRALDDRIDGLLDMRARRMRNVVQTANPVVENSLHGSSTQVPPARAVKLKPPMRSQGCHAASIAYFEGVAAAGQLPKMPKCLSVHPQPPTKLSNGENDEIDVDMRYLNMGDDQARPILQGLYEHDAVFKSLLLAGNPRVCDQTHYQFLKLMCSRSGISGRRLQSLDFSGCTGFGILAFDLLTEELRKELADLTMFRLDGINIPNPDANWPRLEASMQAMLKLEELSLSDMSIGRGTQRGPMCVADLLLGVPKLTSLDISHNYFSHKGCEALAHNLAYHSFLQRLDMSYNADGSRGASGSHVYNPLAVICEGLVHAQALKYLSLAQCQLNYEEDFILEDALAQKRFIGNENFLEELDLSGNPCQGRHGARCLIRMLIRTPSITKLVVRELDEALPLPTSIAYEMSDPSAEYSSVNLGWPQHRAFVRTLLRRSKEEGQSQSLFTFQNSKMENEVMGEWNSKQAVPTSGEIAFTFNLPTAIGNDADIVKVINEFGLARKMKLSLWAFVRLCDLFRDVMDSQARSVLVHAMSGDVLVQLPHVKYMSVLDTHIRVDVIEALLPAVHRLDRHRGFDLIVQARLSRYGPRAPGLHEIRSKTFNLLLFNPYSPQTHYALDLSTPSDRRIMEQIIIINTWEGNVARSKDRPDLSQHGGHECLRNTVLNGQQLIWKNSEYTIPQRGDINFDYCTPFRVAKDATTIDDAVLLKLIEAVLKAELSNATKVAVLRTKLHKFTFTAQQCAELLNAFPAVEKAEGLPPRVDAFVSLYPRVVDIGELLSSEPHGLYGLELLSRVEVLLVRKRLGRFRTWDLTRLDAEQLVPGDRPTERKAQQEEAEKDMIRMRSQLADYGLRDDPTSLGNANRYALLLDMYEDWQCTRAMMQVAQKESGAHFDSPSWSEKIALEERGSQFLVPGEWLSDLPKVGTFTVRYFIERPAYKDLEARVAIAEKLLGW